MNILFEIFMAFIVAMLFIFIATADRFIYRLTVIALCATSVIVYLNNPDAFRTIVTMNFAVWILWIILFYNIILLTVNYQLAKRKIEEQNNGNKNMESKS